MQEHRVQNWHVRKPLARSRGGVVATQNRVAGKVGARVLAAGGNAVDAAVATGFALAAVEPWNSGLGGFGFMLVYLAKERRVSVVDFGPVSPCRLDPAAYPLAGGGATSRDLFTWPAVKDDCNVHGPLSFAVPAHVDGLGLALEKFGTLKLAEVVGPAIELAERGIPVDWFLTLKIATSAKDLARYGTTRDIWMRGGLPPVTPPGAALEQLQLKGLARTLTQLSAAGRRDFYEGSLAEAIVKDVKAVGGVICEEDLRSCRARIVEPLIADYHGAKFALAPGLTAGPSMARALDGLRPRRLRRNGPHADAFVAYAEVLRETYAHRLETMGEIPDRRDPSSTSHLNVIDRHGNMVALTQTLLSVFGSKVVLPGTGILMNNGIMWFDPRPGAPNCIAPGKRPLTNMCPVLAFRAARPWFAIGASGGRKILPAVLQISSFLIDHGLYLEDAFHHPRIDASEGEFVAVDPRMPAAVLQALAAKFPTRVNELVVYPTNYACPSAVMRDGKSRENFGATDVMSPWSGAVSEDEA